MVPFGDWYTTHVESTFITVAGLVVGTLLLVGLVVLVVTLVRRWSFRTLPVRKPLFYRGTHPQDWGQLNPTDQETTPPDLLRAVHLLRGARLALHRTLTNHHRRGAFPAILEESNLPIYAADPAAYLYVLEETIYDADARTTKKVQLTPACTWTVQVGTSRLGRPREATVYLTVDHDHQPVLHTSADDNRHPATPTGWTSMVTSWPGLVGRAAQGEHDP